MVFEVFTDACERMLDGNTQRLQEPRWADAGQLEQHRRIVGAARQDHLATRRYRAFDAAAPAAAEAHAGRPLALEQDLGDVRVGQNPQVGTLASGMQEGGRGADPPAAINRALHIGHAFLERTVVVGIARNAEREGALDEGLA